MRATTILFRSTAAAMIVFAAGGPALAARPDTRAMTCAQGRAVVAQYGSIVMTTGQYTYDRIVHNVGFCGPGQQTDVKTVPSLDTPYCRIGYICRERIFND